MMRNSGIVLCAGLVALSGEAFAGPPCTLPGNGSGNAAYNFDTCGNPAFAMSNGGTSSVAGTVTATAPVTTPSAFATTTVTTAGTAVTILAANAAPRGAYVEGSASCTFCLDLTTTAGTATGANTGHTTKCLSAGQGFNIPPSTVAVSANSPNNSCSFGYGNVY